MADILADGTVASTTAQDEAIAIIGMSCRFPQAPSPSDFWQLLRDGRSAISRSPRTGRWEGRLTDHDRFDAGFFGISRREANAMDPQQRLVLELAWEAVESAGLLPARLGGTDTGLFLGVSTNDYAGVVQRDGAAPLTHHAMTGTHRSILANRVSYHLDLRGPSITVDAGQASSLVAVHLACASLRGGESSLALVGGVQLNLTEAGAELVEAFGGLSPDGRSRAFDADANGFVRGEGAGLVVLKRLSRALADGDRVHAVIRGSAVNHGGAAEGLTVPRAEAQTEVLRAAHRAAGIEPAAVQYVELHGTGTKVGDPVEAAALGAAFGAGPADREPLRVGSVKTNIGHLEAAAGIAGLLKVTLALSHGVIPASLNFRTPNPRIDLDGLGLRVQTRAEDWPSAGPGERTAGVSSFSMGGTNCHVVLAAPPQAVTGTTAEAPQAVTAAVAEAPRAVTGPVPWVLSARTERALRDQAGRLRDHLAQHPSYSTADIGHSLATTRTAFDHRAVVIATDPADFRTALEALAAGADGDGVITGRVEPGAEAEAVASAEARIEAGAGHDGLAAAAARYVRGEPVDWRPAFAAARPRVVDLPTYAFQRERCWWPAAEEAGASNPPGAATEEVVFAVVAEVLGEDGFDAGVAFRDLGFDSLMSVELRNRLCEATGLRLPETVVFDHPTPAALSAYVAARRGGASEESGAASIPVSSSVGGSDPVVIVGMACRFPGGVVSPEGLWDLVVSGGDGVSGFPVDRGWGVGVLSGEVCGVREGGFVEGVGLFDAGFFGVSPREAAGVDPGQRLLLECAWEVLERAGVGAGGLRGSGGVGVFVGGMAYEYGPRLWEGGGGSAGYLLTGSAVGMASGRISYVLGLEGPSVSVDTACSSSLVALHLAVQSLRSGECGLALVGGVTVMGTPGAFVEFSRQGGLAGDGRCRSFSSDAGGTGWGEGVGVLLVERLSDARRLGHRVLAVVAGSAVNSDGASNGLTAPSGGAQRRVVRAALRSAGLGVGDVDVVEGHGTGTRLGDPIEAQALVDVFGGGRGVGRPLWVGSLKSNVGHAQGAAGVGGVIKMVMAMRHGVLPRTLHVVEPVGGVDWSSGDVRLLTEAREWVPAPGAPRRAGVSSFGISGTNAHVILEEAPEFDGVAEATADSASTPVLAAAEPSAGVAEVGQPLVLSAKTATALRARARRLHDHLAAPGDLGSPVDPASVACTAARIEHGFDHRAAVLADPDGDYRAALAALAAGEPDPRVLAGVAGGRSRVVFVFAGDVAELAAGARELLAASPVFAARVRECAAALEPYLGQDVAELTPADPPAAVAFVVGAALARLWAQCGVRPDAVLGRGVGELVAALVAEALGLDDAARLCAALVRQAGDDELRSLAAATDPGRTAAALRSSRTGEPLDARRGLTAEHWLSVLREPVDLTPALRHLTGGNYRTVLAMPGAAGLAEPLRAERDTDGVAVLDGLGDGSAAGFRRVLALAYTSGLPVDWTAVTPRRPLVVLPTYPFERRRYWLDAESPGRPQTGGHPLLDTAVTLADREARVLTGSLSTLTHPWLADHTIRGTAVLPGTALVELAAHAAGSDGAATVAELVQQAPIHIPADGGTVQLQYVIGAADASGEQPFSVYARPGDAREPGEWTRRATGTLAPRAPRSAADFEPAAWPPPGAEPVELDGVYQRLAELGYQYGPAFQGLRAAWRLGADQYLDLRLPDGTDTAGYGLHPALLDAALHAAVLAAAEGDGAVRLPFSWSGVRMYGGGASRLRVRVSPAGTDTVSLRIADEHGTPLAAVDALVLRAAGAAPVEDGLFQVAWRPLVTADREAGDRWLLDRAASVPAVAALAGLGARVDGGEAPPAAVLVPCFPTGAAQEASLPGEVHRTASETLALLQAWLADARFADTRLVLVTRGAVRTSAADQGAPALVQAPLWGLVRSAQAEEPGRFLLLDVDRDADLAGLPDRAVRAALACGEPEVALRGGELFVPRLVRLGPYEAAAPAGNAVVSGAVGVADGTVLVTGGTGALGALVARHLVARHGVRHLLLTSRRGEHAPGAAELAAELRSAGAQVRIAACDCADRDALRTVLAGLPAEHPLVGVVHAAGIVQDATVRSMTDRQLTEVISPKVDAAWNLHELTLDTPLAFFELLSSVSGTLGTAGQGNYSLANTFLDALAEHRADLGLPARSLAWGLWDLADGMAGRLAARDLERLARVGLRPIDAEHGLRLFDAARALDRPALVAPGLDLAALRSAPKVRALLRELVSAVEPVVEAAVESGVEPAVESAVATAVGAGRDGTAWSRRMAELPDSERVVAARQLVVSIAAEVLGGGGFDAGVAFRDLGFDSLMSVELRNRLCEVTGFRLPPTVVFDHPSPTALGEYLGSFLRDTARDAAEGPEPVPVPSAPVPVPVVGGSDPVVIVGMACRFPGGVVSPEGLWDLVVSGGDGVSGFPVDRGWGVGVLSGEVCGVRVGGFVEGVGLFDAGFFGVSPREAAGVDPGQRLLLECAWEVLERAGVGAGGLRGSGGVGVFVGGMAYEYGPRLWEGGGGSAGYLLTGSAVGMASGRISYVLGLEGPSVSVDTACSSSLVALHLAVQSLRSGECGLALVGGVTVMGTPGAFVEFSRQGGLAGDGRCRSFSSDAGGTGWGEGVGVLLVERLSDARRLGHRVLAVVAGSAVNSDGASNGLTAPSGGAQRRVVRAALRSAGLGVGDVDVVEGHGTGTRLGDPIEAQALVDVFGGGRGVGRPLWLGSLKSNVGHAQGAAGVGGVIKMVMAMRHGVLPRTLHVVEPVGGVDWSSGDVRLLTEAREWVPAPGAPRRAGVSSFGISGTNAHVILEEPPADPRPARPVHPGGLPLVLSAKTATALRAHARRLHDHLAAPGDLGTPVDPASVAYTAARIQHGFDHRAAVLADPDGDYRAALAALAEDRTAAGLSLGTVTPAGTGRRVFMFAGQGTQRPRMGRQLHQRFPVYAAAFDEACAAFDPYLDRPLASVVFAHPAAAEATELDRTGFTQPALFATEYALFQLVRSWGVRPDLVLGHSVGELVAAQVAGVFSLADAAKLVAARGRLMQSLPPGGAMVSVRAPLAEVEPLLTGLADRVGIAAVNGPAAVVVSGEAEAVSAVVAQLAAAGHRTVPLTVSHAFHSPLMAPVLAEFTRIAAEVAYHRPTLPVISTLTGRAAEAADLMSPEYWAEHIRRPVRFADGIAAARAAGGRHFVEIGPDSTLSAMASAVLAGLDEPAELDRPVPVPLLRGARDEARTVANALAAGFASGLEVDWPAVATAWGGELTTLPTYPFERRRYWLNPTEDGTEDRAEEQGAGSTRDAGHPVLDGPLDLPETGELVWSGRLDPARFRWLGDHVVAGRAIAPGALVAELACQVARPAGCDRVAELVLESPLPLGSDRGPDRAAAELRLVVRAVDAAGRRPFALFSRPVADPAAEWERRATGVLAPAEPEPESEPESESESKVASEPESGSAADPVPSAAWPPPGAEPLPLDGDQDYAALAARGLGYGPAFRGLRALWRTADGCCAELVAPAAISAETGHFGLHPALLDAALHPIELLGLAREVPGPGARIPFLWQGITRHRAPATGPLRVRLTPVGPDQVAIRIADADGRPVLSVESLTLRQSPSVVRAPDVLRRLSWSATHLPEGDRGADGRGAERIALITADAAHGSPDSPLPPGSLAAAPGAVLGAALGAERYPDVAGLLRGTTGRTPDVVLVVCPPAASGGARRQALHDTTTGVLTTVQGLLSEPALARCRIAVLTGGAVRTGTADPEPDPAAAAVWGLVRCAQQEEPGRLQLLDVDTHPESAAALGRAIRSRVPQGAVRRGGFLTPELTPVADRLLAPPPGDAAWRLDFVGRGTPDDLALTDWPEADAPLGAGRVRVALHAAGVNFRDVLLTLGVVDPRAGLPEDVEQQSVEGAGVVLEVGPGVGELRPGDRVMGLFDGIGPVSVTDRRLLCRIPAGWSFAQAAAVPVGFLTAYYGLVELGRLRAGERVLVHTATGAVGIAARQLARHLGAEVFATASPAKWPALRAMGVDPAHIASSRDDSFEAAVRTRSGGHGLDVVLNSLAGALTDASLRLLAPGGRFLEMGKTDQRDPEAVAGAYGGVEYTVFDIRQAGPDGIQRMFTELLRLFDEEVLTPPPVTTRHLRAAPAAFRHLAEARHIGKVVLTVRDFDRDRAVLITGGLGTLGGLVARHLVTRYDVRQLVLVGRRGTDTPGSAELVEELGKLGAEVSVAAVDAGDRAAVGELLAGLAGRGVRIGAVVHAAGTTRDAVIGSLTPEALAEVLRAKADAALNLHELTADLDLSAFVLFSSVAGVTGSAGQGNYAAANAFLDALAEQRHGADRPALSIAWGLWEPASGITGRLRARDHERLARQGIHALSAERGLALFDEALAAAGPTVVAAALTDPQPAGRPGADRGRAARAASENTSENRSESTSVAAAAPTPPGRARTLLDLVRAEAAAVLGHASAADVPPEAFFPQLGFDSLGAIELRNRIAAATGLSLSSTLIFDFPSPSALAAHLREECPDWAEEYPGDHSEAARTGIDNDRGIRRGN
ncbi:SDR family NAD(P)-dependent oxidoreductase [Kitasatospora sp. NPDC097643]|uniref:SDR family NAD(P)-dependent oxidoreductase n=1 Tax=Kitasatospora sp. NPDC097643 TaxID=3157230 RepID=UPI0033287E21